MGDGGSGAGLPAGERSRTEHRCLLLPGEPMAVGLDNSPPKGYGSPPGGAHPADLPGKAGPAFFPDSAAEGSIAVIVQASNWSLGRRPSTS